MRRRQGFTLIELLVVISIIALLIGLLLPALGAARRSARQMQNSSQIRGIHQALVTYSQTNKSYYPGIRSSGKAITNNSSEHDDLRIFSTGAGNEPELRLEILMANNYFQGDYVISPGEVRNQWSTKALYSDQYSYALLGWVCNATTGVIDTQQLRVDEWRETINSLAVVISDRNTVGDTNADGHEDVVKSIWTQSPGEWRGSVGRNDNHVALEDRSIIEYTQYGKGLKAHLDSLFLKHSGDSTLEYEGGQAPAGAGSATYHADANMNHDSKHD